MPSNYVFGTARLMIWPFACALISMAATSSDSLQAAESHLSSVSALGRLQPKNGILTIGVPSTPEALLGSVLTEVLVAEGDFIEAGQLLVITGSQTLLRAKLQQANAQLELAKQSAKVTQSQAEEVCVIAAVSAKEAQRRQKLLTQKLASQEETEAAQGKAEATAASCKTGKVSALVADANIEVAKSHIAIAEAELGRATIKSPFNGLVLEVLAQPGEFVGIEGLLKLGRVDQMYAIAEVYESDISRVKVGQTATIRSTALPSDLTGKVELIRHMVHKQDVTGTDPAADRDARIIEVEILLDDSAPAASLSNLQVEIIIDA